MMGEVAMIGHRSSRWCSGRSFDCDVTMFDALAMTLTENVE